LGHATDPRPGTLTLTAIDPPELADDRIVVRVVTEGDLDAVHEACQDPEIQLWTSVPSPYRREHAERFLALSRNGFEDGTGAHMVVVDGGSGELLGACGLDIDRDERVAEVGYWTAPQARGRGVATRATRLVCRWALEELGLERLSLRAAVGNVPSNRVARRLGFVLEGTLRQAMRVHHPGAAEPTRVALNTYGLLPGELR
jgi:RimJ/RimL family protein N-acetyltransferase